MRREQLIYLLELHKTHSIHAAGEKLNISPQALGASMRALEKELGLTLLNRSRTGVQLTADGQAVAQLATAFWTGIDGLTAQAMPTLCQGSLEMYVTYGCMHCFMPHMIKELSQAYPALTFNIHELSEDDLVDKLKDQTIPYALTMHCFVEDKPYQIPDEALKFVPFSVGRLYAMIPHHSPLADYKQVSIKTLLKQPLLLYSPCPSTDNSTYPLLKYYGQPKHYEIQHNHIVYKSQLVTGQKIGLTFTTPFQESQYYKGFLHNVPIKENIQMYIGYLALKDSDTQEIERLLDALGLPPLAVDEP